MAESSPGGAASSSPGLVGAIMVDLIRLHESWMGLVFPRQRDAKHSVLGKWTPTTTGGMIKYRSWGAIGVAVVGLLYPFVLMGFAARFYARRIDKAAASLGIIGVVLLSLLAWGALSAAAYFSRISYVGFLAVAGAGGVATVSAALAVLFARIDGRIVTVLLAYPFAMTALFLPPVVAALYWPPLATVIFPSSRTLAIWLLDNVLYYGGIGAYLESRFRLEGFAFVGMWFGIAVPLGWFFGIVVTLANVVRPSGAPDDEG